jgi:hypothetical protein
MKKTARFANPPPRAPWERLDVDWREHDWARDPAPLIAALRAYAHADKPQIDGIPAQPDKPLPLHLCLVLIDLLERYNLKLKPGAKRIPSYNKMSMQTARVLTAAAEFGPPWRGPDFETAVDAHARDWDLKPNTLRNELLGKRGRRRHYRTPKR